MKNALLWILATAVTFGSVALADDAPARRKPTKIGSGMVKALLGFGIVFLGCLSIAQAQIPEQLQFRGVLTDTNGIAIDCVDALVCSTPPVIVVRIYTDAEADIAPIFEETHEAVFVDQGIFDLEIGTFSPLDPAVFDQPLFLGLEINGDGEALPRQSILSVPTAFQAINAQQLGGLPGSEYVTVTNVGLLTSEQHQALTGGPDSLADAQHGHSETEPSLPAGMIAFFPGSACPPGWAEYAPLQGRIVVGVSSEDTVGAQVGDALGNQGSRTIVDVPSHSHLIDPPDAASTTSNVSHTHSMNHTHGVNPPSTGTSGGGAHTHNLQDGIGTGDGLVGVNVGGGGNPGVPGQSGNGAPLNTTSNGNHSHSVDIGGFTSGGSSASQTGGGDSAHNHSVNIPSFVSSPTGATAVDVTMPYLQLLACQLQ